MPLHPTLLRPVSMLSFHLRLGLLTDLFHSGFPNKILYALLLSPVRAACLSRSILNLTHRKGDIISVAVASVDHPDGGLRCSEV